MNVTSSAPRVLKFVTTIVTYHKYVQKDHVSQAVTYAFVYSYRVCCSLYVIFTPGTADSSVDNI